MFFDGFKIFFCIRLFLNCGYCQWARSSPTGILLVRDVYFLMLASSEILLCLMRWRGRLWSVGWSGGWQICVFRTDGTVFLLWETLWECGLMASCWPLLVSCTLCLDLLRIATQLIVVSMEGFSVSSALPLDCWVLAVERLTIGDTTGIVGRLEDFGFDGDACVYFVDVSVVGGIILAFCSSWRCLEQERLSCGTSCSTQWTHLF